MFDAVLDLWRQNASWLEIAWTCSTFFVGVMFASRALCRAVRLNLYMRRAKVKSWEMRRRGAKRLRDSFGAYYRHVGFTILGLIAMARPAPLPADTDFQVAAQFSAILFISWAVYDVVCLIFDDRDWTTIVSAFRSDPTRFMRIMRADLGAAIYQEKMENTPSVKE